MAPVVPNVTSSPKHIEVAEGVMAATVTAVGSPSFMVSVDSSQSFLSFIYKVWLLDAERPVKVNM